MGVGVYTSDFNDTGAVFSVSGPLCTSDEHEAYRKDGGELDQEQWAQDEYDDFVEHLAGTIAESLEEIGFSVNPRKGFPYDRASFDNEFVASGGNGVVELGWRSWQHDFVVAVAAESDWMRWLDGDDEDYLLTKGRLIDEARGDYDALRGAVLEYVRLSLMENGVQCNYRTGAYTQSAYELEGDESERAEHMNQLRDRIGQLSASLSMPGIDRIIAADSEARVNLLRAAEEMRTIALPVIVPFYDTAEDSIVFWYVGKDRPFGKAEASEEALDHVRGMQGTDELTPLEWDDVTTPVFRKFLSGRGEQILLVSVSEYVKATEEALVINYEDENGKDVSISFGTEGAVPGMSR